MAKSMGDDSNFISEESDNNIFNRSDNVAVANSDVEIIDVNKLKTKMAALKMFVTEQLYIIKQSVGSPKTSVCNCSSKNNIYIDSLYDQIDYLREESKMKNSIIQSLLCHSPSKNVNDEGDTSSPISEETKNGYFNNNLDNLLDKAIDDSFVDTKENDHKKDEDSSKPLEHKNITIRKKKKKKYHSEKLDNRDSNNNNKDDKNSNHDRIDSNNRSTSSSNSKETVFILGDSVVKKVNGFYLTRCIKHKFLVKGRPFSSAKTRCIYDHAKPTLRELNPECSILHVCTNDLNTEKTASQISKSILHLANSLKNETNTIHFSLIVPRNDHLNNKVNEVNSRLINMCQQRNINIINHTDTIDPSKHLNESLFHLNRYGAIEFANKFKKILCNLD